MLCNQLHLQPWSGNPGDFPKVKHSLESDFGKIPLEKKIPLSHTLSKGQHFCHPQGTLMASPHDPCGQGMSACQKQRGHEQVSRHKGLNGGCWGCIPPAKPSGAVSGGFGAGLSPLPACPAHLFHSPFITRCDLRHPCATSLILPISHK